MCQVSHRQYRVFGIAQYRREASDASTTVASSSLPYVLLAQGTAKHIGEASDACTPVVSSQPKAIRAYRAL